MRCLLILLLASSPIFAQKYQLSVQLASDKSVHISLCVPAVKEYRAYFVLPLPENRKTIALKHYISQFSAYDAEGELLPYQVESDNTILIERANRLCRIEYSWLLPPEQIGKSSHYLINRSGYFGYIAGYAQYPYHIAVTHLPKLFGATSLEDKNPSDTLDIFELSSYEKLMNCVILYAPADTSSFVQRGTRYHIAVYSETGKITARQVRYPVQAVVEAAANYLQYLPKQYHFIFTFSRHQLAGHAHNVIPYSGYADAASSFYALPEVYDSNDFYDLIQPQAMHELLHSIAPFALHSREAIYGSSNGKGIGKHLWLYEGVTEYLSQLLLVKGKMKSEIAFWHEISHRLNQADQLQPVILTDLSEHIYRRQSTTARFAAYSRGMVAAFYLDILLQDNYQKSAHSALPPNLFALLERLIEHYKGQPFNDDALFDDITAQTLPEIGNFLRQYIGDKQPLPNEQMAALIGMQYFDHLEEITGTFGDFNLVPNYKKERLFFSVPKLSDKKHACLLPFERGDMLLTLNGDTVTTSNMNKYLPILHYPKPDIPLQLTVLRQGRVIALSAIPRSEKRRYKNAFRPTPTPTHAAQQLRYNMLQKMP